MHKIRNKNFVASPAVFKNNQIELLHADEFSKAGSRFTGVLPEETSLRKSFDLETEFFYTIENFDSDNIFSRQLAQYERGLAHIEKSGDKLILVRDVCIEFEQISESSSTRSGFIKFPEDTYLVINSYIPNNYLDLYLKNNSVVCSTAPKTPSPVEIEENSVLGRLEGEIQSVGSSELALILTPDYTVDSLQATSRPILIASDYVELTSDKSKLVTSQFVLKPRQSKPRNRQAGSIIFNEKTKSLEFFNGTGWVKIKTE
tara:strand:- start:1619 stop:2395 length:777 start_codon:yes stop_codon:yes gene_type:complete